MFNVVEYSLWVWCLTSRTGRQLLSTSYYSNTLIWLSTWTCNCLQALARNNILAPHTQLGSADCASWEYFSWDWYMFHFVPPCLSRWKAWWPFNQLEHCLHKIAAMMWSVMCIWKQTIFWWLQPICVQHGSCRSGDNCAYAHGVFEGWLSASKYHTEVCPADIFSLDLLRSFKLQRSMCIETPCKGPWAGTEVGSSHLDITVGPQRQIYTAMHFCHINVSIVQLQFKH